MATFEKLKSWINEHSLNHQFSNLGEAIARHPLYFLIIPVIITAILSTGLLQTEINRDHDWLYTDPYGKAARNKRLVEELFPINTSLYHDYSRMVSTSELTMVLIKAKDGGSMLREDAVNDILTMDHTIKSIEVEWKGTMANYSTLCAKTSGRCIGVNNMEVISNFPKIRKGKYKIKYPITLDKLTYYYEEYISFLGGVKVDEDGYVEDVKAVRLGYFYDSSDHTKSEAINKWETLVYNYITKNDLKHLDISITCDISTYKSTEELTFTLLKLLPIVLGVILLFSALTCMTDNWTTSRPWLGILASVSALLAIVSGFGLAFHLGIPYLDSFLAAEYIVLATEIDDAFVFISTWRTTNPEDTVAQRMRKTFEETATSVTVSSLTNIISCSVGMAASVPAFRILCIVAVCCSVFAYVYQLTFFGACLALSGYNEERSLFSAKSRNKGRTSKKGDIFMLFLKNTVGNLLTYPLVKVLVVIAFLANLAIGIWGCTQVKYGMGIKDLFPSKSTLSKAATMRYTYFSDYPLPIHVMIKEPLNYADSKVQSSIEALTKRLQSHPHIADSELIHSWLAFYKKLIESPAGGIVLRGYNMTDKQDFIDGLRYGFLRIKNALQFNFDIKFNENYTDIVASRFIIIAKDINCTATEVETIKDVYEIASESDLPVEVFGFTFHWLEQALIVKDTTIQTASLAIGLSCLIFFVFSRNIRSSLCVSFVVLCTICETIGYFSFWGVGVDFVSLTIFIVSVGFSVNYPAHMAFTLITEKNLESKERIKSSIYRIGVPLIQGALSTVFGLFVMLPQPVYTISVVFKVLSLISLLTTLHSLFFIPVILELNGICVSSSPRSIRNRSHLMVENDSEGMRVPLKDVSP